MDNQQERLLFEIGWFSGILDGEGCFSIYRQRYRGKYHYRPSITIANTNPKIIEYLHQILKKLDIGHYIIWLKKPKDGNLPVGRVDILGLKRCKKFIDKMDKFVVNKRREFIVLKSFVAHRLAQPWPTPIRNNYVFRDDMFFNLMKKAKKQNPQRLYVGYRYGKDYGKDIVWPIQ